MTGGWSGERWPSTNDGFAVVRLIRLIRPIRLFPPDGAGGARTCLTGRLALRGDHGRQGAAVHGLVAESRCGSYLALVAPGDRVSGGRRGDVHYRVCLDDQPDTETGRRMRECADVLYSGGPLTPRGAERVLRDHPGCRLVAGARSPGGCLVAFRGGTTLTVPVRDLRPDGGRMDDRARPAAVASFLHGWLSSRRPAVALASVTLLASSSTGNTRGTRSTDRVREAGAHGRELTAGDRLRARGPGAGPSAAGCRSR